MTPRAWEVPMSVAVENEVLLEMENDGLRGLLGTLGETVEESWVEIDAHPGLEDDDRAKLIQLMEQVEEAVSEAKKIIGVSSENDT